MPYDIVVSGHLCADLLPETSNLALSALSSPGKLFEVDALEIATGGSVSNTGLALHKLGINVGMMTTVGDDLLGRVIIAKLKDRDPTLGDMIAIRKNEASSYSIILSPENADRIILHCTGNNQHFSQSDIDFEMVKQAKIFHLGYPPLLPQLYADGGQEMMEIYQQIYDYGVLTSLDMAHPDPNGSSGKVNWKQVLEETLPYVDIFLPSIEEIVFMFRRTDYDNWNGNIVQNVSRNYLRHLADELLSIGSTIV
ncbi:MAG: carbohydrate kinase family protein, partial [Chloroflexota bacterium]